MFRNNSRGEFVAPPPRQGLRGSVLVCHFEFWEKVFMLCECRVVWIERGSVF